jgi:hypothetical protein
MAAPRLDDLDRQIAETQRGFVAARDRLAQFVQLRHPVPNQFADQIVSEASEYGLDLTLSRLIQEPRAYGVEEGIPTDRLTESLGAAHAADVALDMLVRDHNLLMAERNPDYKPRMQILGRIHIIDADAGVVRDPETGQTYPLPSPDAVPQLEQKRQKVRDKER